MIPVCLKVPISIMVLLKSTKSKTKIEHQFKPQRVPASNRRPAADRYDLNILLSTTSTPFNYTWRMLLKHLHLPGLTQYTHASRIQDKLVKNLLNYKANPKTFSPPDPTIITAEFHPVYTCGRREIGTITLEQKAYLTSPTPLGKAEFHEALRGGQTTFHGPGQLVAYPILDLKRHGLSARCYVHLLEECVMRTCAHYGVPTMRTANPGVWTDEENKICALGVHLRRNVSSHGVGLNVSTDVQWFGRIVACGLEGKGTTSLALQGAEGVAVGDVGKVFVKKMAEELDGVEGVKVVEVCDVEGCE